MRRTKVRNKYKLTPADISRLRIVNYSKIAYPPFIKDDALNSWYVFGGVGQYKDGYEATYRIDFFDKLNGDTTTCQCSVLGGLCPYNFETFFDKSTILNEIDLELQEALLGRINWLLDKKIVALED